MEEFNYGIKHIPGIQNKAADYFSRNLYISAHNFSKNEKRRLIQDNIALINREHLNNKEIESNVLLEKECKTEDNAQKIWITK
jgi:hypothetical protein